jgi:regulator of protease activity HflC (stomatin/prohibitin superfamily)
MNKQRVITTAAIGFFGFILILLLSSGSFITIHAGQGGILFRTFGKGLVMDKQWGQGFHIVAPWNKMLVYDLRIQERQEEMEVLASNGLEIKIDLSLRYKPVANKIAYLHDQIGTRYPDKIIIPEIRSATRKVIGKYTPEELYSKQRDKIQDEIFSETAQNLTDKYVTLDAILIRSVILPSSIQDAIQRKLEQEQSSAEYEFRLEKESKEAQRKRIEAQGIKDFQDIVAQGISDKLLKWKGIEATQELAKSTNTKIVIVGGADGLPLILNN